MDEKPSLANIFVDESKRVSLAALAKAIAQHGKENFTMKTIATEPAARQLSNIQPGRETESVSQSTESVLTDKQRELTPSTRYDRLMPIIYCD